MLPYAFCGQLQTDLQVGFGSGVAVRNNVVLTAAHMVFNDSTKSYVTNAWWSSPEYLGVFQPEPLAARGWYVLSGYAAQRSNDLSGVGGITYQPDQPSQASRDLDVAALFFASPVAGGGSSGYISSDIVPNQYLTGISDKILVGYPVDGSLFGQVVTNGGMYATFPPYLGNNTFSNIYDQVYAATWFYGYPGESGAPVFVQYPPNGMYYPAAVYLGTLFDYTGLPTASVVRAIDSNVFNLINLAASAGASGTNNSGGGVVTFSGGFGITNNPGGVEVTILPLAAVQAGAAWTLSNVSNYGYSRQNPSSLGVSTTNAQELLFKPIPGWNLPTNQSVSVLAGHVTPIVALYTVTNPLLTLDFVNGLGISGTTNTSYQIQSNDALNGGAWIPFLTNTVKSPGINLITNKPHPGFYRALWLTN